MEAREPETKEAFARGSLEDSGVEGRGKEQKRNSE